MTKHTFDKHMDLQAGCLFDGILLQPLPSSTMKVMILSAHHYGKANILLFLYIVEKPPSYLC